MQGMSLRIDPEARRRSGSPCAPALQPSFRWMSGPPRFRRRNCARTRCDWASRELPGGGTSARDLSRPVITFRSLKKRGKTLYRSVPARDPPQHARSRPWAQEGSESQMQGPEHPSVSWTAQGDRYRFGAVDRAWHDDLGEGVSGCTRRVDRWATCQTVRRIRIVER